MDRLNIYRVNNEIVNTEDIINEIQHINNELSLLFKTFGTERLDDILLVCLGHTNVSFYANTEMDKCKFELLLKFFHPTSYRLLLKKDTDKTISIKNDKNTNSSSKNDKINDEINDSNHNLECSNVAISNRSFHLKVYGMQVIFHNIVQKKSIVVTGIVDDIMIDISNNKFINEKITYIHYNIPHEIMLDNIHFKRFLECLSLKEYLIYSVDEIYSKFTGYITNLNTIRNKSVSQTIKEFLSNDLIYKRLLLIQLLIFYDNHENQYLSYLFYDI
jgi:hypothetical protein